MFNLLSSSNIYVSVRTDGKFFKTPNFGNKMLELDLNEKLEIIQL
jgi:hypothetical protein